VFDNTDDFIDYGTTNIILPVNITLSAWIYQTTTAGYKNIITKEGATNDLDYGLTTSPNGNLYFWFHNGSFRIHETTTNIINSINTWYNVVSVFDDTNNTVKMYVNGVLIYNQPENTSLLAHSNSKLFVGWRNQFISGQAFSGRISQVQLYNKALSDSEVLQNYNTLKSRFGK
jgi:MSHA biogenesis protein MshQ